MDTTCRKVAKPSRGPKGERRVRGPTGTMFLLFFGTVSILSNWHEAAGGAFDGGPMGPLLSSEVGLMMKKALCFDDHERLEKMKKCKSSRAAKGLGRKVVPFNTKRWDEVSLQVMIEVLTYKFSPANKESHDFLMSTGDDILVEASPYDKIWGTGLGLADDRNADPAKWKGTNRLGEALMAVRSHYAKASGDVM